MMKINTTSALHCFGRLCSLMGLLALCTVSAFASPPDFNSDGFNDLAVGVPGEDFAFANEGAINVVYGAAGGLSPLAGPGPQFIRQGAGIPFAATANDRLGASLAWGDFNGDGTTDLAVGAPGKFGGAGAVYVLYGQPGVGLTSAGAQIFHQNTVGVFDIPEAGDGFGSALAVGDFNNDGIEDLAVGVPYEDLTAVNQGLVHLLWGVAGPVGAGGLTGTGSGILYQGYGPVPGIPEPGDNFGFSLTAGDFDAVLADDLAIGIPGDRVGGVAAGAVIVDYNMGAMHDYFQRALLGSAPVAGDSFGYALTTGNFNADAFDDLAIGAPGEEVGAVVDAGGVHVIYGNAPGLDPLVAPVPAQWWTQNSVGVLDASEASDRLGWSLTSGDFDGDTYDDLAIGVPYEDIGAIVDAGAVNLLRGSVVGIISAGNQLRYQNGGAPVLDVSEAGDLFGYRLSAGRFNGGLMSDLVATAPSEDVTVMGIGVLNAGAVTVIYDFGAGCQWLSQSLFADGCQANDTLGG